MSAGSGPAPLDIAISRATRLLVVSPHPDDGSLGGAGLMRRVIERGGAVRIVYITSGDAFSQGVKLVDRTDRLTVGEYREYGAMREHESTMAAAQLGISRANITFLGFPDDGLCQLIERHQSATVKAFQSPYTHRSSPPERERLASGVAYRAEDVADELRRVIDTFKPTVVLMPDSHDEHPDHCSTHMLVHAALDAAERPSHATPIVLHYLIHLGQWPMTIDGAALSPPERLQADLTRWRTFTLTRSEAAAKRRALGAYKSQVLAIRPLISSFERTNELFLEGDADSPAPCWCSGEDVAAVTFARSSQRVRRAQN